MVVMLESVVVGDAATAGEQRLHGTRGTAFACAGGGVCIVFFSLLAW
jgi:hypothetical protein